MLLEYCSECGKKVDDEAMSWGAVCVDKDTYLCPDCVKAGVRKDIPVQTRPRSSNSRTPAISAPPRSSNSRTPAVGPQPRSSNSRTPAIAQPRSSNSRNPLPPQTPHGARTTRAHHEKNDAPHSRSGSKVPLLIMMILCAGAIAVIVALQNGKLFKPATSPAEKDRNPAVVQPPVAPAESTTKVEPPKTDDDPREKIAAKYLEEAKAFYASDPKNVKAYRDKLADLKLRYGFTAAGKEAEKTLQDPVFSSRTPDDLQPDSAWEKSIDLLAAIDVKTDALRGTWSIKDNVLVASNSQKELCALLVMPYIPPLEYDVRMQAMRKQGNDSLGLNIPRGKYGVTFMPGAYQNKFTGFDRVGGKRVNANSTAYKEELIRNNQRFTVVLQVREKEIKAYLDGKLVSTCNAPPDQLSVSAKDWSTPFIERLNLGSWRSLYEIYGVQVLELSGKGRLLTSPDRNTELQKGLWASYWKNDDKKPFHKMIMARAETDVGFEVTESKLDDEVPADNFSIRYSGVLRIDVPGKYQFIYSADDIVEAWIDGKNLGVAKYQATLKPEVELTAGDHPIKIEFTEHGSKAHMRFLWIAPGDTKARSIPAQALWFDPTQLKQYETP